VFDGVLDGESLGLKVIPNHHESVFNK